MNPTTRSRLLAFALVLSSAVTLPGQESPAPANRLAQPLTTVAPNYPYLMRHSQAEAEVTVAFSVNTQGVVTDVRIVGSTNPDFIKPSLEAVKQWTFAPAIKDGQPVEARLQQTFTFSVRNQAEGERAAQVAAKKRTR